MYMENFNLSNILKQEIKKCIDPQYGSFAPEAHPPLAEVLLEIPPLPQFGEFSSNIAMKSSKLFKKSPMDLARAFLTVFRDIPQNEPFKGKIGRIEAKTPGFINFFLTPKALYEILVRIFNEDTDYGRLDFGAGKKIQIEFVSANPTGPLSVAHARQAAVGDALANILNYIGFDASREYYVNDGGNQINILGHSIKCRAIEILGGTVKFPDEGYQGAYIKDMAGIFLYDNEIRCISAL